MHQHRLDRLVSSGRLPARYDFAETLGYLNALDGNFLVETDEPSRTIDFVSERGAVYSDLNRMLVSQKANLTGIPSRFTLVDIDYTYQGPGELAPDAVVAYFHAVKLCSMLAGLADYPTQGGLCLHFIVRPDARFKVTLDYGVEDLRVLPELDAFTAEYINSDFHRAEKYAIARDALADLASGSGELTIKQLVLGFSNYARNVRASYSLLLSKFTAASVAKEISKQNLDDSLRLNKSFSDIQNQLLALPAALLVAGASISYEAPFKSVSVLIGISIFAALMWMLIANQKNSVGAIGREIDMREADLASQPDSVSAPHREAFRELHDRVKHQLDVLVFVRVAVITVFLSVAYIAVDGLTGGAITSSVRVLGRGIQSLLLPSGL
ncbi:TPA: hypothetical protein UMV35_004042 [Stenotrophomonas maltophilia]|nr:hypothetical protein [Stenotrophomonas maltophilia]HEL3751701.1 hypothetical protein [Stenotrophomonas maltophilia]HEL7731349.1 hypothetical protein [Stenotrophomonas maltophilia]